MKSGSSRDGDRSKMFSRRLLMLGVGQAALMSSLVGRMYYLQVVKADRYKMLAEENRISIRLLAPPRGRVVDRFDVPLVLNRQNFRVLIVSEQSGDVGVVLDRLARLIALSESEKQRVIRDVARKRNFVPVPVREGLTWEEMARVQVNAPDLPGISIDEGLARYYPFGNDASHILGYVSAVSEKDLAEDRDPLLELPGFRIGKAGVEREYDKFLRGTGGTSQVEVNAVGRVIRELSRTEGQAGGDLSLSIDSRLQSLAARSLGEESGTVVVMEVMTGSVLALASQPGYDPNAFNRVLTNEEWNALTSNPKAPLTNKSIAGQYAPGSTFKMIVAMAALEAGVIKPEHTAFCPGHYTLGNARFHCWKRSGHGHMNMVEALKNSCDVYFYEIARRLDADRIAEMANRLGLGKLTGIQLPGEQAGLIPTRAWKEARLGEPWQKGENLVMGIGQGYVTATPLQLAVMTARIASGGLGITPTIIRSQYENGKSMPYEKRVFPDLGLSRTALDVVQRGMWEVVNGSYGTAWRLRLPGSLGVEMAGKTGTSQVRRISKAERESGVIRNEHLPWERRDHALFVCYAPYDSPRYTVAVVIEHGGGGGSVAGPIAREVMIETLRLDSVHNSASAGVNASAGNSAVAGSEDLPPVIPEFEEDGEGGVEE